MFFRKARATKDEAETPSNEARSRTVPVAEPSADEAIDALGDVLRAYGEACPEIDEETRSRTESEFSRWARHVLVGAPLVADPASDERAASRDFRGAVRFFRRHRKDESERVTRSLLGLRETVWTFLAVLAKAAHSDGRTDRAMKSQLDKLRGSLESGDLERLRAEAGATVASFDQLIAERANEQRARMAELAAQVRTLGQELEEAKREGELDGLTRLHNRACFDRFVERTAGLALLGTPASLLMVDLDHFKGVNDTHGHRVGDAALKVAADALLRVFPRRDDLVARYGGEEFAVVLRNTKLRDAELLAARVVQAMRAVTVPAGAEALKISVSVGVAELVPGEGVGPWIDRADGALYAAKSAGRDRAHTAPPP
ncbi:MAG: diguanylate cyclase [Polyangiaceae bacterium]